MVTSAPNITLKLVHKPDIISTQVSPLFVRLLQNQSINLLSVHNMCKYMVKHFVDIVRPLKMNQFILQFLTNYTSTCLVLFCFIDPVDDIIVLWMLSNGLARFSIQCHGHIICSKLLFSSIHSHLTSAQWLSCALVTYILSQDFGQRRGSSSPSSQKKYCIILVPLFENY